MSPMVARYIVRYRILLLLALAALAGVLVAQPVQNRLEAWCAGQLAQKIHHAPAVDVPVQVDVLLQLNQPGWQAAASLLLSSRPEVSQTMADAISQRLDSPQSTNLPQEADHHLATLLPLLAKDPSKIPASIRPQVRAWCRRALRAKPESDVTPRSAANLVAACELLLLPTVDDASPNNLQLATRPAPPPVTADQVPTSPMPLPVSSSDVNIPLPAGAPLPEPPPQLPRDPSQPREFTPYVPPIKSVEPRRFIPNRVPKAPTDSPEPVEGLTPIRPAQAELPVGTPLKNATDREVMQALWGNQADLASEELARRGYQANHRQLAKEITSPDPADRLVAIEKIPRVAGIKPKVWLQQLTADPDTRVAKAARSMLAAGSQ